MGAGVRVQTGDTLSWHRKLVARKWDYSARRGPGRPPTATAIKQVVLRMARENPVGARNSANLCDLRVSVDHSAESIATDDLENQIQLARVTRAMERVAQRPVRTVDIEMRLVLGEHPSQVAGVDDHHSIEDFTTYAAYQRSMIAFARGAWIGVLMIWMPSLANTASNKPVNFESRSRIKNWDPLRGRRGP